ncbi:hypothetical protein ATE49_12320 [Elizabethkingia miricola]|uniref:Tetratricopeptide repeat protein n=1 Tax=Elizabethkingia miricola TaxID=172045 RepID=A0ABD5BC36_ELIMR|nr:hypothetical protein [Elizabethkingia miricola]MDQ8751038.1 hypothetical protein [Elizabethkingia miricola]NHQ67400.1 hypothetical protein [Elizabethkingia miricola]OBS13446.1 hypothetical protein ATE49_12320 [Elizabethkingia miricola]OPB84473.1 hypothetical protein BAS06_19625 [Elizabethkingia miricola]PSL88418.1 hypothetical protein C7V10_09995 [Elizabethkingia miricola]
MKYLYFLIINFLFCPVIKKNDNTLSLHIEYKKFLHQSISYNFFTIHEQFFTSNNIELAEINDLLKKADDYIHTDYPASLIYAEKACAIAEEINNSEKKAEAYYYIARCLIFIGKYKESKVFLDKGMDEKSVKKSTLLTILFKQLKSVYYSKMYILHEELKENIEIKKLISTERGMELRILNAINEMYIGDYYTETANYKLAHIFSQNSIELYENIPISEYSKAKRIYKYKAYAYFYKSWIYLKQNNPEPALYYIQKAYNQSIIDNLGYISPFLEAYGNYYYETKNYEKAISFYLKAIENKKKFGHHAADINMKISKLYGILGDHSKEKLYLKISSEQRIIDENKSRINVQEALNAIVKEQNRENKKVQNNNNLKIATIIVTTLLLTGYIHTFQKKKEVKALHEKTKLLHYKRMKIKEKEEEIEKLQNQMNESFTEVINLAKENSPEFISRFKEVYPIVYEKILKVNPKIKTSELTFFAYLYFGFSTKDIATYTCVTVHAVEVRKNRFRKKYNISSDVDLNNWIEKLE